MATASRHYAVYVRDGRGDWVEFHADTDRAKVTAVYRRLLEAGPGAHARLFEVEVLRDSADED